MDSHTADRVPLCVDLDGTLVNTDTLWESLFRALRRSPLLILKLPLWLLRGRAFLKRQIAVHGDLDATTLPYNAALVKWLGEQRTKGRRLWLATAADISIARSVASATGLFEEVIASNGEHNLKGRNKRDELVRRTGERGYDYAGNDSADFPVWSGARRGVVVSASDAVQKRAAGLCEIEHVEKRRKAGLLDWIKCLRVHQWAKNGLLFVPLITSHRFDESQPLFSAVLAFVAFSLCASSVYILNDLFDLPADRKHHTKHRRALASGLISLPVATGAAFGFLVMGFALAALVNTEFFLVLLAYYATTLLYSLVLKTIAMVDVLVLAGLYVVRVIGGAAAAEVELSFWLLAFSMFLFLSLALVKRSAELIVLRKADAREAEGRGYRVLDLEYLHSMGTAAGYLSVLVLALYINSPAVLPLYTSPQWLWLLCPLMLYWVSYVWLKTGRGEMNDDPVLFAIRDRLSIGIFGVAAIVLACASLT